MSGWLQMITWYRVSCLMDRIWREGVATIPSGSIPVRLSEIETVNIEPPGLWIPRMGVFLIVSRDRLSGLPCGKKIQRSMDLKADH